MRDGRAGEDQARQERAAYVPAEGTRVIVWPVSLGEVDAFDGEAVFGRSAEVRHRREDGWVALQSEMSAMMPAASTPDHWVRKVEWLGNAATELALSQGTLVAVPTSAGAWRCRHGGQYVLLARPDPELLAAMRAADRLSGG